MARRYAALTPDPSCEYNHLLYHYYYCSYSYYYCCYYYYYYYYYYCQDFGLYLSGIQPHFLGSKSWRRPSLSLSRSCYLCEGKQGFRLANLKGGEGRVGTSPYPANLLSSFLSSAISCPCLGIKA